jgi:hypothetical protein
MAGVARQAASSLTTAVHQPVVNGSAPVNRQPSGAPAPGGTRPQPPYPSVPRPVSGGQARGAASVRPVQQQQPPPYRHPSVPPPQQAPPMQQRPESSGGRQVLIVLAVVLALLVLLCAGVISFLLKQGNTALGEIGTTVARTGVVDEGTSAASYRLMERVAGPRAPHYANEGRRTL